MQSVTLLDEFRDKISKARKSLIIQSLQQVNLFGGEEEFTTCLNRMNGK